MEIVKSKKDILVKTYLEYENYLINNSGDTILNIFEKTITIFYKINSDEFKKLPYVKILDLYKNIETILNKKEDLVKKFKYDGVEYGINPDFGDITLAELVDCDTDDIIKQICILYRPIIKKKRNKYIIEAYKADIKKYEELKEALSLDIYYGFINFFFLIEKDLLKSTLNYTMEMVTDPEQKKILEKNGLGIQSLINYVTKT